MRRMGMWNCAIGLALALAAGAARAEDGRDLGRVTAKAAMVVDAQSGVVEFARNPTLPLPPASTTKLLTALIALRQLSPDRALPVSFYASTMPPTKAGLKPGWQVSARDLLYALMLHSSNDASVVIAEGIAGSVPAFARLMNATARGLGATQSNFVTPNGLPAADHYSTARDMTLIMRQALQTPGMRDILSTRTAVIQPLSGSNRRIPLRSTNRLLWREDLHVIGKTGWTRQARRCFVGAASGNGREVIVAVLGSRNLWSDVEALVDYGLGQSAPADEWRGGAAWQQAATSTGSLGSAWSRASDAAGEDSEVVAPPHRSGEQRAMRVAALAAPTSGAYARRRAPVRTVETQAQGDAVDVRRNGLHYSLHLGSFRSKARAEQLARDLSKHGYRAAIEPTGDAYRVTVRDLASRDAARRAARTLSRALHVETVIIANK
jgi:D-alanyl-D-alanine carboxypeptidase